MKLILSSLLSLLPVALAAVGEGGGLRRLQNVYPSTANIDNFLIVGMTNHGTGGDCVNLQNGEYGADQDVLSTDQCDRGTSLTDSSFPSMDGNYDQRWKKSRDGCNPAPAWCVEYTYNSQTNCCAPAATVDWSGNIASTSTGGMVSVSNTDIYGDLKTYGYDDIAILAAGRNPVQSISNAQYFPDGHGPGYDNSIGKLPENSAGTNGVGFHPKADLGNLKNEINSWSDNIKSFVAEHQVKDSIENRSHKDSNKGPFIIELLPKGATPAGDADWSFDDKDGDGVVIIDVRADGDWSFTNSDVIIVGDDSVTAIFRVRGGSNTQIDNSSIQRCEGSPGILFAVGVDEANQSGDAVMAGSNAVLNNVVFWELVNGSKDSGTNQIDCQNCQGCSQFIADVVLHTSTSRFNKCTFGSGDAPTTDAPTSAPTGSPTSDPTGVPTKSPTASPTTLSPTVESGHPSASPTTGAPTSSPTESPTASANDPTHEPTSSPTDPVCDTDVKTCWDGSTISRTPPDCDFEGECALEPTPSPTTSGSAYGDPHIKTWGGDTFDFHGGCDLVLLHNPEFADGVGMTIHIRTEIRTWWSFIKAVSIRIGDDVLEVEGGAKGAEHQYWVNGVAGDVNFKGFNFSKLGLKVNIKHATSKQMKIRIDLLNAAAIGLETYHDFVRVNMQETDPKWKKYSGAVGLMGSYPSGETIGRDGVTVFTDMNAFGQDWQVREDEPKLFHTVKGPQHPAQCTMPEEVSMEDKRRRLGEGMITHEEAELACARVDGSDRDACVFDVLASNDKDMAGSY